LQIYKKMKIKLLFLIMLGALQSNSQAEMGIVSKVKNWFKSDKKIEAKKVDQNTMVSEL